jgi:hypothetical protein
VPGSSSRTFEGGHIPIRVHDVIGRIVDWFARHLGPVSNEDDASSAGEGDVLRFRL